MKKCSDETQTLHAGCSKAEPKNFAPPQTPFLGVWDCQKLISWRWSLPLPTNPIWWESMHAISGYCGNRPTHAQTHTPTHRQDRLQYTAPQLACSVKIASVIQKKKTVYIRDARVVVSEMTYTVSSGTLNSTIPYHTLKPEEHDVKRHRFFIVISNWLWNSVYCVVELTCLCIDQGTISVQCITLWDVY